MAVVKVYDQTNKEIGEMTLAPEVFEVEVRPEILHLVVRQHQAAARAGTHATRNRSRIHGGGHKPWRQKGTGRARSGSSRSPIWRGGAVTFGPQPRDYSFKINKQIRKLAIKMALSARLASSGLVLMDGITMPEIKTKKFKEIAQTLGLKKALIIVGKEDNNLALSARNIPGVTVKTHEKLNVYDVLAHPQLIMFQQAAELVQERLK